MLPSSPSSPATPVRRQKHRGDGPLGTSRGVPHLTAANQPHRGQKELTSPDHTCRITGGRQARAGHDNDGRRVNEVNTRGKSTYRAELDIHIDRVLAPFAAARDRLDTITGVGSGRPSACSPRSGWTCRCSPPPATWPHGRPVPGQQPRPAASAARGNPTRGNRWLGEVLTWVRLGSGPQPRQLPVGPVLAARPPHRQKEGGHGRGPLDPGGRLVSAH